jgi:hypothetical protein
MNKDLTEKEIDELVISQTDDADAWEKPIRVNRKKVFSLNFPKSSEILPLPHNQRFYDKPKK